MSFAAVRTAWPGPTSEDRAAWEAYRLTPAGACLPPYDEADDTLRALWWGTLRLTLADIDNAVAHIVGREPSP